MMAKNEGSVSPIPCVSSGSQQLGVVAIVKKHRGRPLGSKNKAKPGAGGRDLLPVSSSLFLPERDDHLLKPIVLVVPPGKDIVNAIINFGCKLGVSISVHHASGTISQVHLCNSLSPSGYLYLRGNFHMSSLSGFYTKCLSPLPPKNVPFSFFNIQFFKENSLQLFGGLVGCKLVAAQPVHVMASIIKKHDYHEIVCPITNPNTNHNVGSSTSSFINAQPPFAPSILNMFNRGHDNY